MSGPRTVVLCRSREDQPARRKLEEDLLAALTSRAEVELIVTPYLYDLAPEGPSAAALRAVADELVVLAWMPERAMHATLAQFGVAGARGRRSDPPEPASQRTIWCVDLRRHAAAEDVLALVGATAGLSSSAQDVAGHAHHGGRQSESEDSRGPSAGSASRQIEESTQPRWYPVVDRQRCVNCLECLNFCLFGVYELDAAGRVTVQQPDACRPGCPACARVCPAGAILFPECPDPAIAGDAVARADEESQGLDDLVDGLDRMEP